MSYRNLLIYRTREQSPPFNEKTTSVPPHDITDQLIEDHLPSGPGSELLRGLMTRSETLFQEAKPLQSRRNAGERLPTGFGCGDLEKPPAMVPFLDRFGKTAAVITAVDLLRGISRLLGWKVVEVPGATGYTDTDYRAKACYAIDTLLSTDFVVVHVEATDEASHEGDAAAKVQALENIDRHIVGPMHDHLKSQGEYRILISPDHPTLLLLPTTGCAVNASVLCLVSVLTAPPTGPAASTVYTSSPQFERVIRAQTPQPFYQSPPIYAQGPTFGAPVQPGVPIQTAPPIAQPGMVIPNGGGIPVGPPVGTPVPGYPPVLPPLSSPTIDPFLGGSGAVLPLAAYSEPPGLLPVSYSMNGLHPYRFGVTHRLDFGLIPEQSTKRDPSLRQLGNMGVFEFDYESEYTTPIFDRSVFSYTFQYGLRSWNGPNNASPIIPAIPGNAFINAIDLPGNVHRFGGDFELTTPLDYPVVFQAGFNPSINSDFENGLSSRAWNFDARGVVFHRVSPRTTLVGGVLYWDRVDDVLLPYIGVIRRPTPRREYVLVFPHPRISFMIGDAGGIAKWLYVRGEYHVESYQIERRPLIGNPGGQFRDQIELRDWRVLGGIRTVNPYGVSAFFEAGAVFGREVEFLEGTTDFDISSGFIARAGLHF